MPVGIENDEVTGGKRVVYHRDGKTHVRLEEASDRRLPCPGSWANVDGRLGVVMAAGSGLSYHQATGYDPHTAVCPDVLYGSFSDRPQHFKAGDQVAQRIVLFFVEVTPRTTSTLSRSFSIAEKSRHPRAPPQTPRRRTGRSALVERQQRDAFDALRTARAAVGQASHLSLNRDAGGRSRLRAAADRSWSRILPGNVLLSIKPASVRVPALSQPGSRQRPKGRFSSSASGFLIVLIMAQKFSIGVSSCTWWVGPRISPPPWPSVSRRVDHFCAHVLRGAERQRVLLVDRAPEAEPVAILALEPRRVHAGRLDRIQHVHADLDQFRDDRVDHAVGVVGDLDDCGLSRFSSAMNCAMRGLRKRRHIAGEIIIADCPPMSSPVQIMSTPSSTSRLRRGQVVLEGDVEDCLGQVGIGRRNPSSSAPARAAPRRSRRSSSR